MARAEKDRETPGMINETREKLAGRARDRWNVRKLGGTGGEAIKRNNKKEKDVEEEKGEGGWTQRSWRATREIARIRSKCSVDRDIGPGFIRVASFRCTCVCVSRWHFWSTRYALGRVRKINSSRARARACHRWWDPKHSESLPSIYRVRQRKLPVEVIRYLPISRTLPKRRLKRNLSYLGSPIGRVRFDFPKAFDIVVYFV